MGVGGAYGECRRCRARTVRHIEEDTMHPIFTQALAAERIRAWHDEAARDQLAKQARRARHQATPAADELPGPRSGRPWPPRRKAAPVATASEQPGAMASEPPGADDSRQPAGVRAAGQN